MLTENQRKVVDCRDNCCCVALPGSGKSHTVVEYLKARVLEDESYRILAISFSRKAAQELRERVASTVPTYRRDHIQISTFDALFLKQLKERMGSPVRIMSSAQRYNLVLRAMREEGIGKEGGSVNDFMLEIDRLNCYLEIPASEAKKKAFAVMERYNQHRVAKKLWDFSSIAKTVAIAQYQNKIPLLPVTHIVIDEFQDVNGIQFDWLSAYASPQDSIERKVLVCGDDDQGIYSFRSSLGYVNFLKFQEVFKPKTHILDICFRCGPNILKVAESLIKHNENRVPKEMNALEDGPSGMVKSWLIAEDSEDDSKSDKNDEEDEGSSAKHSYDDREVHLITDEISAAVKVSHPRFDVERPKKWAVLARNNRDLLGLCLEFERQGLDYRIRESGTILVTPEADIVSKILETVVTERKVWMSDLMVWMGASESDVENSYRGGGLSRRWALANYRIAGEVPSDEIDETLFYYTSEIVKHQPSFKDGMMFVWEIINSVSELSKSSKQRFEIIFELLGKVSDGASFVEVARIGLDMIGKAGSQPNTPLQEEVDDSAYEIDLMTLHSSKGLQWDGVWLMGWSEGKFPSENSDVSGDIDKKVDINEERRLAYVGMTRAKQELHISSIKDYSLFVANMAEGLHELDRRVNYSVFNKVDHDGKLL